MTPKKASFIEDIEEDKTEALIREFEVREAALKHEVATLKRDKRDHLKEIKELREMYELVQEIEANHKKPPAWAAPKRKHKSHTGIISLLFSDPHFDEVVDPAEVEGLNAYNREIAIQRLERCVQKTIMLSRDYISGVTYDGMYLFLGGDNVSGWIHEELSETNECAVPETVDFWLDPLASAIGAFADHFGRVHCAGVVGNHGRTTRKPRAKRRVTDNIDWLIYRMLARDFRNDSRVSFQIPRSADTTVPIYSTDILFTHGDQFRGGSGISGVLAPMMTGTYRKTKRAMLTDQSFDYIAMGHWHQLNFFKNIIMNGSLKGYDEYAYVSNFEYEPPQQAMWLTTPENGITMTAPVLVLDRAKEGW